MTTVRPAIETDLPAIESLRRADGSSLGFVPLAKYQHIVRRTSDRGRARWRYEWLLVAVDNEDVTGFCLAGFHRDGAKIEQVCVREDARRMERALMLVDAIELEARRRRSLRLRCRVAYDIEANFFWRSIGFTPVATVTSTWLNVRESASKRPLIVYDKELDQRLLFVGLEPLNQGEELLDDLSQPVDLGIVGIALSKRDETLVDVVPNAHGSHSNARAAA